MCDIGVLCLVTCTLERASRVGPGAGIRFHRLCWQSAAAPGRSRSGYRDEYFSACMIVWDERPYPNRRESVMHGVYGRRFSGVRTGFSVVGPCSGVMEGEGDGTQGSQE